jgi:hypothetical protein
MANKINIKPSKPGRGVGTDGSATNAPEPKKSDGERIVERRHQDWLEHNMFWRQMQDSLEGGARYRDAVYGADRRGLAVRNLFRHKREYPDPQRYPGLFEGFGGGVAVGETPASAVAFGPWPGMLGADPGATAQDDDYELRRSRTPVPEFVGECLGIHLSKIYEQEVKRDGPADLVAWWRDVDGCGTPIDDYMRETVAPLLLVNGVIDICLDHPPAPKGEAVKTRADELRLGLDKVVASYILPQNMIWWRKDAAGRYLECLVREYVDPSDRDDTNKKGEQVDPDDLSAVGGDWRKTYVTWRYWTATESVLYNYAGDIVLARIPHRFGRVPIVRLIDLKKHRTPNVGKSRYEFIAALQRDYYNRDSEMILSDTLQAHPFLSGPEDFCKADNTLSVGPGYLLPKKKNPENGSYEGFDYVSPPKDPADSLRRNLDRIIDLKDRNACLTKPAGSAGTTATSVSQSGVSKEMDAETGSKLLSAVAKSLARAETVLAEYALLALRHRPVTTLERQSLNVTYPVKFALRSAAELIDGTTKLQIVMSNAGEAPNTERELIQETIRQLLLGLNDAEYKALDGEIELLVKTKAKLKEQMREMTVGITSRANAFDGDGSPEQRAGTDPTGESGRTW